MHENQGNSVIFYSFYTEDGAGDTGLTVTVDVYEVVRDGSATLIVNDAACTEIGGGLYRYLLADSAVDAAAEYVAIFHTADADTDQKDLPAMWVIDRADTELIAGQEPADVWAYASRTLTQSAASVASVVSGSTITATRGDTLSAALENIGALTNYSKLWFTVKSDQNDADSASIVQIELAGGLLYINGAVATTAANGSITIDDEATGDVTILLKAPETAKLAIGHYSYDIQILRSTGVLVSTLTSGSFDVSADYTRATA